MYVLPTERQILSNNTTITLNGTEYKILDTKGKGASCVAYLAENCTNKRIVLIKELYPINLGIFRDKENNLIVPNSFCEHFKFYKHKLCEVYKLQLEFHNSDETGNYTSDAETMVEAYSTLYVIMNKVVGSSYDKVVPENITDVLEVCKSVATVIGFYHKKGYLHLDIKPDNIYVLKETNQIINLFDFDTVKLKSELENGNYIASTNKISAPEISKAEIDEFTGKYLQEVDERADIYAIGHILFEKVMERDAKSSDIILGKKFNLGKTKLLKNSSPQLREMIQEIFQHTVVRMKSERYSNTDELIKALDQALEIATEEKDGHLIDNNITVTTSNSYYISRKDKLSEIRQHLENYHIAYLYGIGGIGKSETAREYAEEYRDSYTTIQLSIYSGDLKSLIAGLKFSSDDNYFEKDINIRYETKLSLLSKAMINNERTLLIIDNYNVEPDSDEYKRNVEVMKDLKKLHIHILFTTRTLPNDDKTKVDIEEFSKEELRHMFFAINPKDIGKEERIAQVDELIETAYRHTLTVDLVAHQTAKIEGYGKKTLSDYIKVLKESGINSGINVVVYNNKDDNGKSDIIFEHIRALFNLTSLTEKEKYIMVNACLLPLLGMPVAEFESFIDLENYPNSESNDGWGEDSTISNLVKSGWIKRINGEVSKITLHPIVSEVTVNELKPEITEDKCKNFCDSVSELIDKNNLKSVDAYKDIFISSADTIIKNEDRDSLVYVAKIASVLGELAYYSESLCYYTKVLTVKEKVLTQNHPDIAEIYNNIGCVYDKLGNHIRALEYLKKALTIRIKVLPENHPDIATSLDNIGGVYVQLGEYEKIKQALEYCLKALTIKKKFLPENHPDIATLYNDVGSVYYKLGDHKQALEYYLKALAVAKKVLPVNHPNIATLYNNIGGLYGELGEHKKEINYYLKALVIRKKILPENHPDIATSYNNVGYAYCKLGENKSLKYSLKALVIREKILPENHPDLSMSYNNVGCAYGQLGEYEKSLEYVLKTLKIQKRVLPKNHLNIARTFDNIGYIYGKLGKHEQALEYVLKSLSIREKVLPYNHLDIAMSYHNVGYVYGELGEHKQALEYYLKVLAIQEKILSKNHPDIATTYDNIGYEYERLGNDKRSPKYYLKALAIREQILPKNHLDIAKTFHNVGSAYSVLGHYKQALEYFLKALTIFEKELPKNHPNIIGLLNEICHAYGKLGNRKKQSEYYYKMLSIQNDTLL